MITINHRDARTGAGSRRARLGTRNLLLRIASAAVLAPVVLAAAYLGGWYFLVLCLLGACGILWEWMRLVTGGSNVRILACGFIALAAAFAFAGSGRPALAMGAILAGALLAGIVACISASAPNRRYLGMWVASGVIYAGVAFLGPALLRGDGGLGLRAFLFLAATVWMTDICAYAVGRVVGGPLLWPQISPNKTWAGAIGGLTGGVVGGALVAYAGGTGSVAVLGVIALLLSALAQTGDLLESAIKRHFGAKDTSQLIPGHGGLMDRLDGFLVAVLAALVIGVLHQGIYAPARGLLVW